MDATITQTLNTAVEDAALKPLKVLGTGTDGAPDPGIINSKKTEGCAQQDDMLTSDVVEGASMKTGDNNLSAAIGDTSVPVSDSINMQCFVCGVDCTEHASPAHNTIGPNSGRQLVQVLADVLRLRLTVTVREVLCLLCVALLRQCDSSDGLSKSAAAHLRNVARRRLTAKLETTQAASGGADPPLSPRKRHNSGRWRAEQLGLKRGAATSGVGSDPCDAPLRCPGIYFPGRTTRLELHDINDLRMPVNTKRSARIAIKRNAYIASVAMPARASASGVAQYSRLRQELSATGAATVRRYRHRLAPHEWPHRGGRPRLPDLTADLERTCEGSVQEPEPSEADDRGCSRVAIEVAVVSEDGGYISRGDGEMMNDAVVNGGKSGENFSAATDDSHESSANNVTDSIPTEEDVVDRFVKVNSCAKISDGVDAASAVEPPSGAALRPWREFDQLESTADDNEGELAALRALDEGGPDATEDVGADDPTACGDAGEDGSGGGKSTKKQACARCGRLFSGPIRLRRHERVCVSTVAGAKHKPVHECCECRETFPTARLRRQHCVSTGHDSRARCPMCDQLMHPATLRSHLLSHGGAFVCRVCGRAMSSLQSLRTHSNIHTGNKPHVCEVCGAAFRAVSSLFMHRRCVHSEQRPYPCSECPQRYASRDQLRVHLRLHTGERPFACRLCNASFTRRGQLQQHMRAHTQQRRFSCFECGRRFDHRTALRVHEDRHRGVRAYQCSRCNWAFYCGPNLQRHMQLRCWKKEYEAGERLPPASRQPPTAAAGAPGADSGRAAAEDDPDAATLYVHQRWPASMDGSPRRLGQRGLLTIWSEKQSEQPEDADAGALPAQV